MDKVSVIIPTFNRAKFLKKTIKSVLDQTYPVYEVIVCDDGSTDSSKKEIEKIADKRVLWSNADHSGLPAVGRNRGVKLSKGDWIAFLDSDDSWEETKLERQFKALNDSKNYQASSTNATNAEMSLNKKTIDFDVLKNNNYIVCSSVLIKKAIFDKTGLFSEKPTLKSIEDYNLWLKISLFSPFVYLQEKLVQYTKDNPDSVRSIYTSEEVWKQRREIWRDLKNWSKSANLSNSQKLKIWQNYLRYEIKGIAHDTTTKV